MSHAKIGFLILTASILAITLPIIGLVYWSIFISQNQHDPKTTERYKNDQRIAQNAPTPKSIGVIEHFIDALAGNIDRRPDAKGDLDDEYYRDEQDLIAQRVMARWTFGIFIFTGFSVVIMSFGTWLVYLTLRESRTLTGEAIKATRASDQAAKSTMHAAKAALAANDIQRQAFEASQWAYFEAPVIATPISDLQYIGDNIMVTCGFIFNNVGVGPAAKACVEHEIIFDRKNPDFASASQAIFKKCKSRHEIDTRTIRSGDELSEPITVIIKKDNIIDVLASDDATNFILIGIGIYHKEIVGDSENFSFLVYTIQKKNGVFPGGFSKSDIPISKKDIFIQRISGTGTICTSDSSAT